MKFTNRLSICILLSSTVLSSTALANSNPPFINNVTVDYDQNKFIIVGNGLLKSNGNVPNVRLLDNPNIKIKNSVADPGTPNKTLTCDLPFLQASTAYVLRIRDGSGEDVFALTLGATGSAGPQGPAGNDGAAGDTGAASAQGEAGAKGDPGEQGPPGDSAIFTTGRITNSTFIGPASASTGPNDLRIVRADCPTLKPVTGGGCGSEDFTGTSGW